MKEPFLATLLVIAGRKEETFDSPDDDLDDLILWKEIQKQVKLLREDMENSKDADWTSATQFRMLEQISANLQGNPTEQFTGVPGIPQKEPLSQFDGIPIEDMAKLKLDPQSTMLGIGNQSIRDPDKTWACKRARRPSTGWQG